MTEVWHAPERHHIRYTFSIANMARRSTTICTIRETRPECVAAVINHSQVQPSCSSSSRSSSRSSRLFLLFPAATKGRRGRELTSIVNRTAAVRSLEACKGWNIGTATIAPVIFHASASHDATVTSAAAAAAKGRLRSGGGSACFWCVGQQVPMRYRSTTQVQLCNKQSKQTIGMKDPDRQQDHQKSTCSERTSTRNFKDRHAEHTTEPTSTNPAVRVAYSRCGCHGGAQSPCSTAAHNLAGQC